MPHTEITAAVVERVEHLLAGAADHAAVVAEIGVTPYVVEILDRQRGHKGRVRRPRPVARRIPNSQRGIDATTIRRIQRMLEVGILNHGEIAREAGVSPNTVTDVANGKRVAITLVQPILTPGETFLQEPVRCSACRVLISVLPCRACRARQDRKKSV